MTGKLRRALATLAVVAGAAVGGAAIADAASSGSTTTAATTTTTTPSIAQAPPGFPAHGSAAHEDAEKPVTGDAAARAKAAAVKYLGGGTAGEVTTDFQGSGYEVAVTKSDGTSVELHLDSSFTVMEFPGRGGPPPPASGTGA